MRELLGGKDGQALTRVATGQVGLAFPASVQNQHADRASAAGQRGRRGVRDVVRHEPYDLRVQAGHGGGQELRSLLGVGHPQVIPRVEQSHLVGWLGQRRVERIADHIQVLRPQARELQATPHRQFRHFPRGEGHRALTVLAPAEPLLLGGCDDPAVDHERGGRVVEERVHSQYTHEWLLGVAMMSGRPDGEWTRRVCVAG